MKKRTFIVFIILTFIVETVIVSFMLKSSNTYTNDTVKINELVTVIELNYGDESKYPQDFKYCVVDSDGNKQYKNDESVSNSVNEAYQNRDTIVDLKKDEKLIGKVIIGNDFKNLFNIQKINSIKIFSVFSVIQMLAVVFFYISIQKKILTPFKKMKKFASRVADGNLDVPLEMDRNNNFGAFTEAFDVMRHEIKKARASEKKAIEDKKELVAKLSHDIKTPIASIKSSSELGMAVSSDSKVTGYFESINQKSDQINTLITNLFNATLEELEELNMNPTKISSYIISELINNADYLHKGNKVEIEKCEVFADKLRLQQVFDNIFANSYKYADTEIKIEVSIEKDFLVVSIQDFGTSVKDEELPLLTEKFKRGSNISDKDGVGLGLYISKQLMRKMNGELEIENANPGFRVKIYLRKI